MVVVSFALSFSLSLSVHSSYSPPLDDSNRFNIFYGYFIFRLQVAPCSTPLYSSTVTPTPRYKQAIMRTEDRLFDRGWVRSAMATRKCGNIYFPKYFIAVRPFFTRIFFQELFGLEGLKHFLENFVRCTI